MDRKWKSRPENKKNHFMQIVLRTMKKPPSAEACLLGNGCQYYICTSQNDKKQLLFCHFIGYRSHQNGTNRINYLNELSPENIA